MEQQNEPNELDQSTTPAESMRMLQKSSPPSFEPLRRRTRVWSILAFYLPLLVIPWTLTCVMNYRPVSAPSYIDQAGGLTSRIFEMNEGWQVAVNILNTVAAVLTIPVTSLLLAEAAVLWLQRDEGRNAPVPLAQFYDLADRGWTDISIVSKEVFLSGRRKGHSGGRNWFLLAGASLVGFCGVILPLQQLLVRTENMQVLTCQHVPYPPKAQDVAFRDPACSPESFLSISEDPQPGMMEVMPLWNVKEQVSARITTDTSSEHQPLLWTNSTGDGRARTPDFETENGQILAHYGDDPLFGAFWISAVPNGTTTGVLRQHAMRMNSSIACNAVPPASFPTTCPGAHPFTVQYSWDHGSINGPEQFQLRVCAPGDSTVSPWNNSRDAISIKEELYLGILTLNGSIHSTILRYEAPFAMHCTVNTTRGYFELGNYFNELLPQPLLARFPEAEASQYNDYDQDFPQPNNYPPYIGSIDNGTDYLDSSLFSPDMPRGYRINATAYTSDDYMRAPGPLATSAVAIFGNESFFASSMRAALSNSSSAAMELCRTARIPFLSADKEDFELYVDQDWCAGMIYAAEDGDEDYDYSYRIMNQLIDWFKAFNDTEIATNALGVSTFYSSEAVMTQSVSARYGSRKIYTSDGRATQKPSMTIASLVVLSLMLGIEIAALLILGWYVWKTPAWTSTLKSLSIAQLANAMDRGTLPPAGASSEDGLEVLRQIDGRVGGVSAKVAEGQSMRQELAHGGLEKLPAPGKQRRRPSKWVKY